MQKPSEHVDYYVYAILDPRKPGPFIYNRWKFNYEPFYIGKGRAGRAGWHLANHQLKTKSLKASKIKKIRRMGLEPIVVFKRRHLTEERSLEIESKLIAAIGRKDLCAGPLANLTSGGDGISGAIMSKKTRARMSAAQKKRVAALTWQERVDLNMIRNHTDETRKKMSESHKRHHASLTPKQKKLLSDRCSQNALKYNDLPEERKAEIRHNHSAARKLYWSKLTPEERSARQQRNKVA